MNQIKAPNIFAKPDHSSHYMQSFHNIMFTCNTITNTAQKERERLGYTIFHDTVTQGTDIQISHNVYIFTLQ